MSNVSNIPHTTQEYHQPEQKKFNAHVLSEEEIKKLPVDEKKELVMMPGEHGCLWENVVSQGNVIGWNIANLTLQRLMPVFYSMLKNIEPTDKSHLVFGDFRYSFSKYNKVFRALYKGGAGGGYKKPYTPVTKWVENIIFLPPDEANDFLSKEENKGKWEIYGDWKYHPTGNNIVVGLYKHQ